MDSRRWALRQRCHGSGIVAKHVVYRHSLSLGTIIHRGDGIILRIDHWIGGWIWSRFQPGGTRRWQPWFPHNSSAQANRLFIFIRRPRPRPCMKLLNVGFFTEQCLAMDYNYLCSSLLSFHLWVCKYIKWNLVSIEYNLIQNSVRSLECWFKETFLTESLTLKER